MSSQQEVIKKFMASLDKTTYYGKNAVDQALKACSNFKNMEDVISCILRDRRNSSSGTDFLQTYCGIDLNNSDTGAITGSDAGTSNTKTAQSIVPENSVLDTSFNDTSFTLSNYNITFQIEDTTITGYKKQVWQSIYTWWAKESLKLLKESYNYSFADSDVLNKVRTITICFEDNPTGEAKGWMAWTSPYDNNRDGITDKLSITFNMKKWTSDLSDGDVSNGGKSPWYMDRTFAHEMTHAIMAAKIKYFGYLPNLIVEGTAEITQGADDKRKSDIKRIADNIDLLEQNLVISSTSDETLKPDYYSAGYIFLRYLAKQANSINGTSNADSLNNTLEGANIYGYGGNDTIINKGISSFVDGGAGNDRIYNYGKYSTITTGTESATVYNYAENVTLQGSADYDYLYNRSSKAYLTLSGNNSTLYSHSGISNVTLFGGSKNDSILNNSSKTLINGNAGNDKILNYKGSNVTIIGGKGNDVISLYDSSKNNLIIYNKGDGNDTISGIAETDTIKIADSDFTSTTSGQNVILTVGNGKILVKNAKDKNLKIVGSIEGGSEDYAMIRGTIYDDSLNNTIAGASVFGYAGNDTINNRASNAIIDGDSGDDYILTYSGSTKVSINAGEGNDTVGVNSSSKNVTIVAGAGKDSINNWGSTVNINAGEGNDYIFNNGTNVTINAAKGNDTIKLGDNSKNNLIQYNSGDGNDLIYSLNANSTIKISGSKYTSTTSGQDIILNVGTGKITLKSAKGIDFKINGTYDNSSSTVTADSTTLILTDSDSSTLKANSKIKTINASSRTNKIKISGNSLANSITGSKGNDSIWGNAGNDTIRGLEGNDIIVGNDGDDYLVGGKGNDSIWGGAGNDTIYSSDGNGYLVGNEGKDYIVGSDGKDTIWGGSDSDTLFGGKGNDFIFGQEGNDTVVGNEGNDYLNGGEGNDTIWGGLGTDTLIGSTGNDTLFGNGGYDVFVYSNGDGNDLIYDYAAGEKISLGTNNYSTQISGNDKIIKIGNGKLTVRNAKEVELNIVTSGNYEERWFMDNSKCEMQSNELETIIENKNDLIGDDFNFNDQINSQENITSLTYNQQKKK